MHGLRLGSVIVDNKKQRFETSHQMRMAIITAGAAGCSAVFAMCSLKLSLSKSFENVGPLLSVVSCDMIIACVVCHFVFKEYLRWYQGVCIIFVFAGVILMTTADKAADANTNFYPALGWAIAASFGFAGTNLGTKTAFSFNIHYASLNLIMFCVKGGAGLGALVLSFAYGEDCIGDESTLVLRYSLNVAQGVVKMLGLVFLTRALNSKCTPLCIAIVAGGMNLVALLLNLGVENIIPSTWKLVGTCIVAFSVAAVPISGFFLDNKNDVDEKALGEKNSEESFSMESPSKKKAGKTDMVGKTDAERELEIELGVVVQGVVAQDDTVRI